MKRLLPILGISVITISTLFWFSLKLSKDRQKDFLEKYRSSLIYDKEFLKYLEEEVAEYVDEKTDDLKNTTTLTLNLFSMNKMPFDAPSKYKSINSFLAREDNSKTYARIKFTCVKSPGIRYNWSETSKTLYPSAPLINNVGKNKKDIRSKIEIKWDDNPVEVINSIDGGGLPFDAEMFGEFSTLRLSYETTKGTQMAVFNLAGNKYLSEMMNKCYYF